MMDALVQGWCPGALRPMRSGDGLLVRLRICGGILGVGLAAQIAGWSRRWGNGQIDLTSRANLQLRGLSERHLPDLHDAMAEWDLLDGSVAGEAARNVVSSPLPGLDPTAVLDIRLIVRRLERRLAVDAALHDLPGKFGFAIDDGGAFGLADVAADVRFTARQGLDGPEFAIGLGGANNDFRCGPDDVIEAAVALSSSFLAFRRGREADIRRMRDFVAACGAEAIWRDAGLARCCSEGSGTEHNRPSAPSAAVGLAPTIPAASNRGNATMSDAATDAWVKPEHDTWGTARDGREIVILGLDPRICSIKHRVNATFAEAATDVRIKPEHDGRASRHDDVLAHDGRPPIFVGVGLPFGRIAAEEFALLASAAAASGATELRVTPWRAILVPVASIEDARALVVRLTPYSLILDSSDPRLRVAACPGAPCCFHATTPVRDDAEKLAAVLAKAPGSGTFMHVSGCEKGCAHPGEAAVTLVGRDGRYDVVLGASASNRPAHRNLTLAQIVGRMPRMVANYLRVSPG
jgi:precorrin-3B synthase